MVISEITYFIDGKKMKIKARLCKTLLKKFTGLMFHSNSPPLLFVFNKNKRLVIHSWFCKPFTAIWLDEKMNATRVLEVSNWRTNLVGKGKYLLEIPRTTIKGQILVGKSGISNRKI